MLAGIAAWTGPIGLPAVMLTASIIGLVMAILFHALNGVRVILVDFWSKGVQYQKAMSIAVWTVFLITGAGMAARLLYIMISHA